MSDYFPQYTTDYISGVMSLRKPQTASLKILEEIINNMTPHKGMNLEKAIDAVHTMYPTCTDFERDFMSCQSFLKMSQKIYNISTVKVVILSVCNV